MIDNLVKRNKEMLSNLQRKMSAPNSVKKTMLMDSYKAKQNKFIHFNSILTPENLISSGYSADSSFCKMKLLRL